MFLYNLNNLIALIILPIFIAGSFLLFRIYKKQTIFEKSKLAKLRNYRMLKHQNKIKIIILVLSFLFLTFSILRPMWGVKKITSEANGIDVVFTLDVSKSMKALDMSDGKVDRLRMAKAMISNFVEEHPENRYGLVIFAGTAFVSTPLTLDHSAFQTFLYGVDYDDVELQGTDLGEALKASIDRFYNEKESERGHSIVIISDGGEEVKGDFDGFSKVAKELGIKIFTIGVGSKKEVAIPEGTDFFGKTVFKEHNGKLVKTKLNEEPLKEIAKLTNGEYFLAEKKDDLEKISKKLASLQSSVIQKEGLGSREDRYQYFLAISLLLFIIYLVLETNKDFSFIKKFKLKKIFSLLLLINILSGCTFNESLFSYYNNEGNRNAIDKYYNEAHIDYDKAGEKYLEKKYISENNYSITDYEIGEYEKAIERLKKSIYVSCTENQNEYCDQLYYNLGNVFYRIGEIEKDKEERFEKWNKAIASYEKTLEINLDDIQAQENIEFIKQKMSEESEQTEQENKSGDNQGSDNSEESSQSENGESGEENSSEENTSKSEEAQSNESHSAEASQDYKLDEQTNQQLDRYLEQLEAQEAQNQKYYQQNPDAQNSGDMYDDFFSDDFFNEFFGLNSAKKMNNKQKNNEIDW